MRYLLAIVQDETGITVEVRTDTPSTLSQLLGQADAATKALNSAADAPLCFSARQPVGEAVGANGAILTALGALISKALANAPTWLPTIVPEILTLIQLLGGNLTVTPPTPSEQAA